MAPLLSGRQPGRNTEDSQSVEFELNTSRHADKQETNIEVDSNSESNISAAPEAEPVLSALLDEEFIVERGTAAACKNESQRRRRRRERVLLKASKRDKRVLLKASKRDKMVQFNDIFRQPQRQYQQRQGRDNVCPNSSFGPARIVLLAVILAAVLTLIFTALPVASVDCFKCSSRNGSNPACEDPFHNLNTTRINMPIPPDPVPSVIYHTPCYAGRKNREGLFPASACIKLTGVFDTTGETLVVRHCALDSGSLTQDTELARMSHCGKFQFEGDLLRGCVLACPEDGCNGAHSSLGFMNKMPLYVLWLVLISVFLAN